MVKSISAYIKKSRAFGSMDQPELLLNVYFDAKWFAEKRRKKQDPIALSMVDIKNKVYNSTGVSSLPRVQHRKDWRRAKNGYKVIEMTLDLTKEQALALGWNPNQYHTNINLDFDHRTKTAKNVICVDFVRKCKVS